MWWLSVENPWRGFMSWFCAKSLYSLSLQHRQHVLKRSSEGSGWAEFAKTAKSQEANKHEQTKSDELEWISDDFGSNDQNQVRLRYTIIITDRCTVVLTWFNIFNSIFRLPELWETSGPPISDGDAATCSGVLTLGSGAHQHDASLMPVTWFRHGNQELIREYGALKDASSCTRFVHRLY